MDEERTSVSPGAQSKNKKKKKKKEEGKTKQNWVPSEMWLQTTDVGSLCFIYCSVPLEPLIGPLVNSANSQVTAVNVTPD